MRGPAVYRIRVGGRVEARWAEETWGMQVTHATNPDGETESALVGPVADQGALNGILSALYGRHLPVIAFECLDGRDSE